MDQMINNAICFLAGICCVCGVAIIILSIIAYLTKPPKKSSERPSPPLRKKYTSSPDIGAHIRPRLEKLANDLQEVFVLAEAAAIARAARSIPVDPHPSDTDPLTPYDHWIEMAEI